MGHYPPIGDFIERRSSDYGALEIKYKQGQKPRLLMFDAEGEVAETVPIGGWNEDTIVEYLDDNLGKGPADADGDADGDGDGPADGDPDEL